MSSSSSTEDVVNTLKHGGFSAAVAPFRKSVMVFVSSTFTDTMVERNVLQEQILPGLKQLGREHDIEYIFFDMRYGVKDENTLDHQTWIGCYNALKTCYDGSAGIFFLSLQSGKYGYRMLPRTIPKDMLDARLASCSKDIQALAAKWYILDTNTVPPVYVLKKLEKMNDDSFWKEALPQLRDAFKDLAFFDLNEDTIIGRSVTEYEVLLAMAMAESSSGGVDRLRWLFREVKKGHSEKLDPWQFYSEYKDQSALTLCDFLCK